MVNYLLRMMTSWALVCNVWYLPAMHQKVCVTALTLCTLAPVNHSVGSFLPADSLMNTAGR